MGSFVLHSRYVGWFSWMFLVSMAWETRDHEHRQMWLQKTPATFHLGDQMQLACLLEPQFLHPYTQNIYVTGCDED